MRDRTTVLICLTLSMAWVTISAVYLYPDVKEEFEQHRYLRRIGKLHTPVIPIECPRARGIENQDFIREDKNPNRCWVDLASFRRKSPTKPGRSWVLIWRQPTESPMRIGRRRSRAPAMIVAFKSESRCFRRARNLLHLQAVMGFEPDSVLVHDADD
jgi:hypothetical protein